MERTMSVEDKIRRAEEIYNRRRENEYRATNTRVRVDNTKNVSNAKINQKLKKMIIQIIVCMVIYLMFHYIIYNNYIFSEDFRNKCEEILAYDISFSEMYKKISEAYGIIQEKYKEIINKSESNNNQEIKDVVTQETTEEEVMQNEQQETTENQVIQNEQQEMIENEIIQNQEQDASENIGGAVEENVEPEDTDETENPTEEQQMAKDAEELKNKISFIKPLVGTITSVFGWRNPTVSTVSKYHTGIDIAADKGTDIISATEGTVVLASSKGAYGNHLKIQIEDAIIIYAHCLTLEVAEGDKINQGQVIAKVGSTGNSTGPHLHFEIRRENRYVDPKLILDF